jgi:hypothetical protein
VIASDQLLARCVSEARQAIGDGGRTIIKTVPSPRGGRHRVAIMDGLFVKRVGHGPRVVLLHGGVVAGELCWRQQLPLAHCFALEIVDRAGYGRSQQSG